MTEVKTHSSFHVRTAVYEGPFELLLGLVEERKLLVNDLALAAVTEEFIAHVREQRGFPLEETSRFIAVAATLLLIKSKSLLPNLALTEEEESDMGDLTRRLALYEKAREAARSLARLFGKRILSERGDIRIDPLFAPSRDLSLASLVEAYVEALQAARTSDTVLPETAVKTTVTLEEMMERLIQRVTTALSLSFREFTGTAKEKVETIVSFLALLELVKQGSVEADQKGAFQDIKMTASQVTAPHYG